MAKVKITCCFLAHMLGQLRALCQRTMCTLHILLTNCEKTLTPTFLCLGLVQLGQCKARPFNFYRVCLFFLCFSAQTHACHTCKSQVGLTANVKLHFFSPPVQFAWWAHMHRFLFVACSLLSVVWTGPKVIENNSFLRKYYKNYVLCQSGPKANVKLHFYV